MSATPISRLVAGSTALNTLNIPTVEIYLQKSPAKPSGDQRGIAGVDWEVVKDGDVIQTGTTGKDGKVEMWVPGGSATLRVKAAGATAEYAVSVRNDRIEELDSVMGPQRRLRMLGYHLGHSGGEGNGVDGIARPSREFDRSVLEFQADSSRKMDSLMEDVAAGALKREAGA